MGGAQRVVWAIVIRPEIASPTAVRVGFVGDKVEVDGWKDAVWR